MTNDTSDDLHGLERRLFEQPLVKLSDIMAKDYSRYIFEGVYAIYRNGVLVKIGKTSGKANKKQNLMADRLWGHSESDSHFRKSMKLSLAEATACEIRAIRVDDSLLRGRLENYLMAVHAPPANHDEMRR